MRRFVVAAEGLTKEGQNSLVEFFRERKLGWWHYIDNFWLVYDRTDTLTSDELRDTIVKFRPSGNPVFVMQIGKPITWHGQKPKAKEKMFDWIKGNWSKD
jgi:hypothetical protein